MSASYTIRKATIDDVAIIAHHRAAMFRDMGVDETLIEKMAAPFRAWLSERLKTGEYVGWFAISAGDQVLAGAGLWLNQWIPSPILPSGLRGYILNVYTEPDQRRQGIARRLVEEILADCRARALQSVVLHASDQGRPIYEALGFSQTNEMRMIL